jgi:regulation of enolase protein 1 (concanavalin A-like superfamily)
MPTSNQTASSTLTQSQKDWMIFAYHSFARIVVRKHGLVPPDIVLESLSDEELEQRFRLMQEMAHLPPG